MHTQLHGYAQVLSLVGEAECTLLRCWSLAHWKYLRGWVVAKRAPSNSFRDSRLNRWGPGVLTALRRTGIFRFAVFRRTPGIVTWSGAFSYLHLIN